MREPSVTSSPGAPEATAWMPRPFAQASDVYTVAVLRNLLFAPLVGGDVDQTDLIAIDIQRERGRS